MTGSLLTVLSLLVRWTVSQDVCGPLHLTQSFGNVSSPGYPSHGAEISCKWRISLASNEMVTISFKDFQFEYDNQDCQKSSNSISIGAAISNKDTSFYCGAHPPTQPYISSTGNGWILIRMTIQSPKTSKFLLQYIKGSVPATEECGSLLKTCRNGKCILREWWCNGEDECGDGSDEGPLCNAPTGTPATEPVLPVCGPHQFACIATQTGLPHCFDEPRKCDGRNDCRGGADEEGCSTCGSYASGPAGYITSPNYPHNYPKNTDCTWIIEVVEGEVIQLRFVDFELETGYYTDFVIVYDGLLQEGQQMPPDSTRYYGTEVDIHKPPTKIESSGRFMTLQFHSDKSSEHRGFNVTYQVKGHCIDRQKRCSSIDNNCFDIQKEKCDGTFQCQRGEDEMGCENCSSDKIPCDGKNSKCYLPSQRCDGYRTCENGEDEENCSPDLCSSDYGLFLCESQTCIQELRMCDAAPDCTDGTDEIDCPLSTKVVTAAVIGSLVCSLLLVAALSCTCKLYQLHSMRSAPISQQPVYRGFDNISHYREAPPSYTASLASPHFNDSQQAFIEGLRASNVVMRPNRRDISRRRTRFLRMLSRDRQTLVQGQVSGELQGGEGQEEHPVAISRTVNFSAEVAPPAGNGSEQRREQQSPQGEESDSQIHQSDSTSISSDTDCDTNHEPVSESQRSQEILHAAVNIHRMRIAGGLGNMMMRQTGPSRRTQRRGQGSSSTRNDTPGTTHRSTRSEELPSVTTQRQVENPDLPPYEEVASERSPQPDVLPREQWENSSAIGNSESHNDNSVAEVEPSVIVGVTDPAEDEDDVPLINDA